MTPSEKGLAWKIEYSDTALTQLEKLDRTIARRVLNYMEERVAGSGNPRRMGRKLTGPMGGLWRYRVGNYRVICDIQDGVVRVLVLRVGKRDRVYH